MSTAIRMPVTLRCSPAASAGRTVRPRTFAARPALPLRAAAAAPTLRGTCPTLSLVVSGAALWQLW